MRFLVFRSHDGLFLKRGNVTCIDPKLFQDLCRVLTTRRRRGFKGAWSAAQLEWLGQGTGRAEWFGLERLGDVQMLDLRVTVSG